MDLEIKFFPAGDNGVILEVGQAISENINTRIRSIVCSINGNRGKFKEIIEMIPTYTSILIIYDPHQTTFVDLINKLKRVGEEVQEGQLPPAKVIHVPVAYGGEFGPDLGYVAQHNQLSQREVINLHQSRKYLIYMIGFTPGFPYLGGMREEIATPRLQVPREKIPAGSVGIAGSQTGIYPIESPGGWQLIGRTPLRLFDPHREPAVLFQAGDYIKFEEISQEEYREIEGLIESGAYKVKESY